MWKRIKGRMFATPRQIRGDLLHIITTLIIVTVSLSQSICPVFSGDLAAGQCRPNIVLILVDDMGWRDLTCYGSTFYETPHIDRLASQGMRFTDAYAACSVCSPTRASVLTGQYPARLHLTDYLSGRPPQNAKLQVPDWTPYLTRDTQTIAGALQSANYRSALIGKWHLGGSREFGAPPEAEDSLPEHRGFDVNIAGSHYGQPPDYFFPYERSGPAGTPYRLPNLNGGNEGEYLNDRLTQEAERFIDESKDRPFFLYLPHYAVHTSIGNRLQAKPKTIARYQAKADPKAPQRNAVYAAMIESLDENVGRLLKKLDDLHIADRTIVIFTSDNGGYYQATSQVPLRGAKSEAYEGGIRVPFIVRWPGVAPAASVSATPITSADIFPTCCAAAGVQASSESKIDGLSLLPVLKQTGEFHRDALFWHYPHYNDRTTPHGIVRQGDFKLIEYFENGRLELYDLKNDLGEKENLAAAQPDRARTMQQLLADWRQKVGAQMPTPKPAAK
jgi:arylsulfatase A